MTARPAIRGQAPGDEPGVRVVTRFAPSPTGGLHLGHAASAIRSHDFARERNGRFLLRIEDIDPTRSRPEHVAGIVEDLRWLGLDWDGEVVFQSTRLAHYEAALARLNAMGLLYPCTCTRADIAASASAPHGAAGIIYPGTCRAPSREERAARTAGAHCWRLDVVAAVAQVGPLTWHDAAAGTVLADPAAHGDVVLARKDAPASYHLAVTVDDAAAGVTDIVRGRDLFEATDVHRLLQALLGLPTPRYHHHGLLTDASGKRLAKRDGAPTLTAMRMAGESGSRVAELLRAGELPIGFAAAHP